MSDTVYGESIKITGNIPGDKPCFVISCNRGEIANDTLRSAKEIMHPPVFTASLHTKGDAEFGYVKQSEFKFCIGPDYFSAEEKNNGRASTPYMDMPILFTACGLVKKEAEQLFGENGFKIGIHPGYGMLAEEPEFVQKCKNEGFIFIGPCFETQKLMGKKDSARDVAEKSGIQVVPGVGGIKNLQDAIKAHDTMINKDSNLKERRFRLKAVGGGGGRGQIIFSGKNDLPDKFEKVRVITETLGWACEFVMELNIEISRHYELQLFAEKVFYARECTLMRNHQKEIEEFLSPEILKGKDPEASKQLTAMMEAAPLLAKTCQLDSVATLECIYDEEAKKLYFLEMNTRIQVEHPVTNAVMGVDLLRHQIQKAFGSDIIIKKEKIVPKGHSIEARITNLDPFHPEFKPTGNNRIQKYLPPERTDRIRHYGYLTSGDKVNSFDPMFAKIVGRGYNRRQAIEALFRGLSEFIVEGDAFRHNIIHQLFVISHPKFIEHNYNSETMDEIRTLFLNKFIPFFDENYGVEERFNSPVAADAVNEFYGHHFH